MIFRVLDAEFREVDRQIEVVFVWGLTVPALTRLTVSCHRPATSIVLTTGRALAV